MYQIVNSLLEVREEKQDKTTEEKIKENRSRTELTVKAVIKHDKQIGLTEKITALEIRSMKNNLVISGIEENEGENAKEVIKKIFKEKVKIKRDIAIKAAFRVGKTSDTDHNLIVRLENMSDKSVIFKHTKNLKGQEIYISNQMPPKVQEDKRQQKQKVKINKGLIDAQQQSLEWKAGHLHVDGRKYQPKVTEPSYYKWKPRK